MKSASNVRVVIRRIVPGQKYLGKEEAFASVKSLEGYLGHAFGYLGYRRRVGSYIVSNRGPKGKKVYYAVTKYNGHQIFDINAQIRELYKRHWPLSVVPHLEGELAGFDNTDDQAMPRDTTLEQIEKRVKRQHKIQHLLININRRYSNLNEAARNGDENFFELRNLLTKC